MNRQFAGVLLVASTLALSGCAAKAPVGQMKPMVLAMPAARIASSCKSSVGLPDSTCTPGAVRTTDVQSICHGSTSQYRPPTSYTNKLKVQQISEYGYADTSLSDYEEDHLISLEIGGDGSDPKNLWPEPHSGQYNSFVKDQVENWLHKQVCAGAMTPKDAQNGIATNWKQYIADALDEKANKKKEID
jgi:hypothetical protein